MFKLGNLRAIIMTDSCRFDNIWMRLGLSIILLRMWRGRRLLLTMMLNFFLLFLRCLLIRGSPTECCFLLCGVCRGSWTRCAAWVCCVSGCSCCGCIICSIISCGWWIVSHWSCHWSILMSIFSWFGRSLLLNWSRRWRRRWGWWWNCYIFKFGGMISERSKNIILLGSSLRRGIISGKPFIWTLTKPSHTQGIQILLKSFRLFRVSECNNLNSAIPKLSSPGDFISLSI